MNSSAPHSSASKNKLLCWALCLSVLALAFYEFSESTSDPDLWMHAMLGEQSILTGTIQRTELYSWTAPGAPFINHEVLAEAVIGLAHLADGGTGILLLKVLFGFLTFAFAFRLGSESLVWPQRAFAWVIGAVALGEISFGFAPRPQIFTALALATQLWLLRRIHQGKYGWTLALPPLYVLWINAHGGVLAGLMVMLAAAGATTAQWLWSRFGQKTPGLPVSGKTAALLWLTSAACLGAMFANAWGFGLIRWIVGAVLWPRPEIEEWNPVHLGWDHASFFILIFLAVIGFALSRRPRAWWEIMVCAALMFSATRSVRHTPLFAIAALAFLPAHVADVVARFRHQFARLEEWGSRRATQTLFSILLIGAGVGTLMAAFTLRKEHPLSMEIPKKQYPVAAVEFMRAHELRGNMLSFFDWGEMCLWELPDCAVSIDGRMDACYPHDLILEHWKFYNAQPFDRHLLDIDKADLALLPVRLAGAVALSQAPGWRAVYVDELAVVLVRDAGRFPKLPRDLPVQGPPEATRGRDPFPKEKSPRIAGPKPV